MKIDLNEEEVKLLVKGLNLVRERLKAKTWVDFKFTKEWCEVGDKCVTISKRLRGIK